MSMASFKNIEITQKLRLCTVNGKLGYFQSVGYANPEDIKFCDDEHEYLCAMAKHHEENEKKI